MCYNKIMAAQLVLTDDAGVVIPSFGFGAIDGGSNSALKFQIMNTGDGPATSVRLSIVRLMQNDGLDFAEISRDNGGNPIEYSDQPIDFGTIAAGETIVFWARVTVPMGTTPAGNPRQFDALVEYTGT